MQLTPVTMLYGLALHHAVVGEGGGVRKILSCLMLMKQREGSVMMQQAWEKILPGVVVLVKHC